MLSVSLGPAIYGEPYNPSSLVRCPGYGGRYFIWYTLLAPCHYSLWVGAQLPQGKYISHGRGLLVTAIVNGTCNPRLLTSRLLSGLHLL